METDKNNKKPAEGEVLTLKDYLKHNKAFLSSMWPSLMGPMSPHIHGVLVVDSDTGAITPRK